MVETLKWLFESFSESFCWLKMCCSLLLGIAIWQQRFISSLSPIKPFIMSLFFYLLPGEHYRKNYLLFSALWSTDNLRFVWLGSSEILPIDVSNWMWKAFWLLLFTGLSSHAHVSTWNSIWSLWNSLLEEFLNNLLDMCHITFKMSTKQVSMRNKVKLNKNIQDIGESWHRHAIVISFN